MNPHYKEQVKIVGADNNSRFKKGDRVRHWFAGDGTVTGTEGKKTVIVNWDSDTSRGNGRCCAKHLQKI